MEHHTISARERFTVMDFAEAAKIPVALARRLIRDLGNDAGLLMRAVTQMESQATQGDAASANTGRDAQYS